MYGWEIVNTRLNDDSKAAGQSSYDYIDIRDDRVYTYFSLGAGKRKTYVVQLSATYGVRFYLPAFSCEAIFDAGIAANSEGKFWNDDLSKIKGFGEQKIDKFGDDLLAVLDYKKIFSTDDFGEHLVYNANLSIKTILGVASYGQLAKISDKENVANKYITLTRKMAIEWLQMVDDEDHYQLTFDEPINTECGHSRCLMASS